MFANGYAVSVLKCYEEGNDYSEPEMCAEKFTRTANIILRNAGPGMWRRCMKMKRQGFLRH